MNTPTTTRTMPIGYIAPQDNPAYGFTMPDDWSEEQELALYEPYSWATPEYKAELTARL